MRVLRWHAVGLKVACSVFVSGNRTCPNEMPAAQSISCCLDPRGHIIVSGKQTYSNGMPIFSMIDIPQSSRGFVVVLDTRLMVACHQMLRLSVFFKFILSCLLEGGSIDTHLGYLVLALRACDCGWSCFCVCMYDPC